MLNCQNVSTFKKMLYCLFLFRLWTYVLETLRNFYKTPTRTSSLLISLRLLSLCHDGRWSGNCYAQIAVDHPLPHFSTNGIARISACWNGMQKTPYPKDSPPPFSFFSSFPQFSRKWACSQATAPVTCASALVLSPVILHRLAPLAWSPSFIQNGGRRSFPVVGLAKLRTRQSRLVVGLKYIQF